MSLGMPQSGHALRPVSEGQCDVDDLDYDGTLNFEGVAYEGWYDKGIRELSRAIGREMKFRNGCPGIPEKFKPQNPDRAIEFLNAARKNILARRKYNGWTVYIRRVDVVSHGLCASVAFRNTTNNSFYLPVSQHLHSLFATLDMVLVGELFVAELGEGGEILDLGHNAVYDMIRRCLWGAHQPGEPRLSIALFDIVSMARMNRNAFLHYIPRILDLLVSVGGPLVTTAHTLHFKCQTDSPAAPPRFVPSGGTRGMTSEELVRHLLDTARTNTWEGFVVCNPWALDGCGPKDKAYDISWTKLPLDRCTLKIKDLFRLKVAVTHFQCDKNAVFVMFTLDEYDRPKYLSHFCATDFKKTSDGVRGLFYNLALPDVHKTREQPSYAIGVFEAAFEKVRELLEAVSVGGVRRPCAALATVQFTWMSKDEQGRIQCSGLKKIVEAWAMDQTNANQLDKIHQILNSNSHWKRVNERKLSLTQVNSKLNPTQTHLLKTDGWEVWGPDSRPPPRPSAGVGGHFVAVLPSPAPLPVPVPRPPPLPKAEEPVGNMAAAYQRSKCTGLLDFVRGVYFVLFAMGRLIRLPEYAPNQLDDYRKSVAEILNREMFLTRPPILDFLADHFDWRRFIQRDPSSGMFVHVKGKQNCTLDEITLILRNSAQLTVLNNIKKDNRFNSFDGVVKLCKWFDDKMVLKMVTTEPYASMEVEFVRLLGLPRAGAVAQAAKRPLSPPKSDTPSQSKRTRTEVIVEPEIKPVCRELESQELWSPECEPVQESQEPSPDIKTQVPPESQELVFRSEEQEFEPVLPEPEASPEHQPPLPIPALPVPALPVPALPVPALPAPAPLALQPVQAFEAPLNFRRALRLSNPMVLMCLVKEVYESLFWMCHAVRNNLTESRAVASSRQSIADLLNEDGRLSISPSALHYLCDYLDWRRLVRLDEASGRYHPLPASENCALEEIPKVLWIFPVPPFMRGAVDDPRFSTTHGTYEICQWFCETMALDIASEGWFQTMCHDFLHSLNQRPAT